MSRFTTHLGLRLLEFSDGRAVTRGDRVLWRLAEPLAWEWGAVGSGRFIVVPAFDPTGLSDEQLRMIAAGAALAEGVTDLGSIPRAFRWFAAPDGPGVKAFALHDHLYVTRGLYGHYDRKACDEVLYDALRAAGVGPAAAEAIYAAVRLGGAAAFGR